MLDKKIYAELESAVGPENVSQEPGLLDGYAWQPALNLEKEPWIPRPVAAILPKTTEEVQEIVRICNRYKIKYKAHSTGWAAWGGPGEEGVLQIDLRRMNRIIEIDEKNMYAVIEPYVCSAQLQAEVMKKGLNCHIIGAGANTSPLANATSGWGYGWTGIYTGFSGRNPLAVEWVLPDGELLKLGTLGSDAGWFCGDGPGPSLRGVMRGWGGAQGGLGVFTKAAVKLFLWPNGPREPKISGTLVDVKTEDVPKTHKLYLIYSESYEKYADLAYELGNAEIGYIHCKGAIGQMMGLFVPKAMKSLFKSKAVKSTLLAMQHQTLFMIAAGTERELEYQEKVLKKIVEETGGFMIDTTAFPFYPFMWWGMHRSIFPAMAFRPGGDFLTSMGSSVEYDCAVSQAKTGEKIKRKYIDKGIFIEDLADDSWGGIYEGTSNWGHLEVIGMFDRHNKDIVDGRFEFLNETCEVSIEKTLGFGLSSLERGMYMRMGPLMNNYHLWQARIKQAFDPNNASDASFYIVPIDEIEGKK